MDDTGLDESVMKQIIEALRGTAHLEKAALFGSRARGDFKPESDIDIVIYGEKLTAVDKSGLYMRLENLPVLYKTDLVHYNDLEDEKFRAIIDRDQKVIYS